MSFITGCAAVFSGFLMLLLGVIGIAIFAVVTLQSWHDRDGRGFCLGLLMIALIALLSVANAITFWAFA